MVTGRRDGASVTFGGIRFVFAPKVTDASGRDERPGQLVRMPADSGVTEAPGAEGSRASATRRERSGSTFAQ